MKKIKKPFPQGRVVLDYETDGLSPYVGARPFICGMEDETGRVIKSRPGEANWDRVIKGIIEDPKIEKIAHGVKFELKMSYHYGMNPRGRWHDTMALAVLINEYQRLSLGWLSSVHLKDDSKDIVKNWLDANKKRIKEETGREINYSDVPKFLLEEYLEGDLDKTMSLFWLWYETVIKNHEDLYNMEVTLAYDIVKMEDHGLFIDMPFTHAQVKKFAPIGEDLKQKMFKQVGCAFNPGSDIQLSQVLDIMGINTGQLNKNGAMKASSELLESYIGNEFINTLLKWRAVNKIVGTYLVPFTQKAIGDVIHGSLWQYGRDKAIVTGRLSSTDPNLHNIPGTGRQSVAKELLSELVPAVRRCIIPPPGHAFVYFDYKQIEMMLFTCFAGDPRAIKDLLNKEDLYIIHGKLMMGRDAFTGISKTEWKKRRSRAKEISLSLIYGMGLKALAKKLGCSLSEAKHARDSYFSASPATKRFMMQTTKELLVNGFVMDPFGRKYHVPRQQAYKAVNALCQGTAATVMKKGIIAARPLEALGARPMLTIHDELIVSCPLKNVKEVARAGKELIEGYPWPFEAPVRVDVQWSPNSWGDKFEVEGM